MKSSASRWFIWLSVLVLVAVGLYGQAIRKVMQRKAIAYSTCDDPSVIGRSLTEALPPQKRALTSTRQSSENTIDIGFETLDSTYWVCRFSLDTRIRISKSVRLNTLTGR